MKVISGLTKALKYRKPVVAIGVFDGLHKAHKLILREAVRCSRRIKGTAMVLTFWPHPQKEESLYSLEHRLKLLEQTGIDVCVVIDFNRKFSGISPERFVKDILVRKIRPRYVYVGKNFRFGRDATGDIGILKKFSSVYHYGLKVFGVIKAKARPVSSTYIRTLIKKGKLDVAAGLLSRRVSVLGTVVKGISLGKRLGFATANINAHHEIIPPSGVYAVKARLSGRSFKGVCYIGNRPSFAKKFSGKNIEVHLLDFNKKIYGKYLEVEFIKKIRNEKRFGSSAKLVAQIKKDILVSQKALSLHSS